MPGNVANPNLEKINLEKANTHKKNNEISFNQGILAVIKRLVEQLVLDMSLRDQIIKEANAALESQRIQSIKDSAEELFLAMLEKIEQKLKENLDGQLSTGLATALNQKLEILSKQVQNIFTLKATFAVEQQAIANDVVAIRTEVADIEVALNAPDIATADLDRFETRAVDLEQKVHSVGRVIDGWLQKFDEVSASTEKSLVEVRNSIGVDALIEFINSVPQEYNKANSEKSLQASNIYFNTEKNRLEEYKKELESMGVRITAIQSKITTMRPTNMYMFLPKPSFSSNSRRDEEKENVVSLFAPHEIRFK